MTPAEKRTVALVTAKITGDLTGLRFKTLRGNERVVVRRVHSTWWFTEHPNSAWFQPSEDLYWEASHILDNLVL